MTAFCRESPVWIGSSQPRRWQGNGDRCYHPKPQHRGREIGRQLFRAQAALQHLEASGVSTEGMRLELDIRVT